VLNLNDLAYAGAPSTQTLTSVVVHRAMSGAIFRILSRKNKAEPNFEDVLFVFEELDLLLGTSSAPESSTPRPFSRGYEYFAWRIELFVPVPIRESAPCTRFSPATIAAAPALNPAAS